MAIIETRGICREYKGDGTVVRALRGVDLDIEKGEFAALAGPSGSGKTTLLNIIGALDAPTSGSVTLAGISLDDLSVRELANLRLNRIGFVFQAYNLVPVLSAIENVEYVLLLQGVDKKERFKRSAALLQEVGLEEEMNRRPHELSGGQQQRVAVARAVVSEPDIILADEPTANLDQETGAHLLDMMRELNRKKRMTFLFSTHDPMVMGRAERLLHLLDGKIVQDERS